MRTLLVIAAVALVALFAWMFLDVDQVGEGALPRVEVQGGELPEYDVDVGRIEVNEREREIDVPKVEVGSQKKTVTVPDVEIQRPAED